MYAYITSIKTKAERRPVSKRTPTDLSSAKTVAVNVKRTSPTMALYKEFRRYFSCPVYVLNTIIGPVILVVRRSRILYHWKRYSASRILPSTG